MALVSTLSRDVINSDQCPFSWNLLSKGCSIITVMQDLPSLSVITTVIVCGVDVITPEDVVDIINVSSSS